MNWIKPDWPVASHVHAAVTIRTGGVSTGQFASLNPALHVNDIPKQVQANRHKISQMLQLPSEPIWLQQVHSNRIVNATPNNAMQQADASYTDQAGIVCAVLTADCLPILLSDSAGSKVAAVHAGWRGLLSGIVSESVRALNSRDLLVWLGPAIGQSCFEVGAEVVQQFSEKSSRYNSAFIKHKDNKYLANIYQLAKIELAALGINKIYGGDFCTVTDTERFYSYRRDGETGRMASLIWRD